VKKKSWWKKKSKTYRLIPLTILAALIIGIYYFAPIYLVENEAISPVTKAPPVLESLPPEATHPPFETLPPPKTTSPPLKSVDLILSVPVQNFELCCGLIPSKVRVWGTPTIRNRGDLTAHNVKVTFELFAPDGSRIKLSGEDYLERIVGDLNSGESNSEEVEFTISLEDGYRMQDNVSLAVFSVYSDEKEIRLEEDIEVPPIEF
jgi:hypothetical protein